MNRLKYLVLDMDAVLDRSQIGQQAAQQLQQRWNQISQKAKAMEKQAAQQEGTKRDKSMQVAQKWRQEKMDELELERRKIRLMVMEKAGQFARNLAQEHGISLVLRREMVLVHEPEADLTDRIIQMIDESGHLDPGLGK